ncbi:hypothetical protein CANCADRAFT_97829 [Tortispora caseinolytica NRRL Y-17796]|uniref:RING-type E3 ubiquitin transferase n=1 Tax=Tortispora caseinolytica NRRL Y-17796 TaxID=767744 RepID=A0A1E4TDT7_9ASCO|nr:hypothetical protein CANCADRAFT_97829 [Tortispora caseinolytica NRRL Y-17796]
MYPSSATVLSSLFVALIFVWMVVSPGVDVGIFPSFATVLSGNESFVAAPAAFGVFEGIDGVEGERDILVARGKIRQWHDTACGDGPTELTVDKEDIIVVGRGNCSFFTKIYNLQQSGARSVIVHDWTDEPEGHLVTMYAPHSSAKLIDIPSVFVSGKVGSRLRQLEGGDVSIFVNPERVSLLDSILFFVFSPMFSLVMIYGILLGHRYLRSRAERAPPALVKSFPVRIWTDDHATQDPREKHWGSHSECVICLEKYVDGESQVMTLPCEHEFHAECIKPWLIQQKRLCPICKRDVTITESTPLLSARPSPDIEQGPSDLGSRT